ncbi:AmmeMemoRadiSam system radical SAM enzyme [bacterium]|nr:AmmeMemoRadiSam system radical SAM enzyme [bacterium]
MNSYPARFWHRNPDGRIQCDLCPRECKLKEGQRGLCFVRQHVCDQLILTTYNRSSGFCIDPVEKKPLNHFLPGTPILSFGTAGCNLTCKFCQNWDISRSKEFERLTEKASPRKIAAAASLHQCDSVALTYNEPVIFLEYGKDVADACHELGLQVVAVTNGYIHKKAREAFFSFLDAANVDLKAFTESFYKTLTGGDLKTVLDTLSYIRKKTDIWLEITTLVIPGENDSDKEIEQMVNWILNELGPETPLHFSAFHPDYKMTEKQTTSLSSLIRVRDIAREKGMYHVYTGNVAYTPGDTTFCHNCNKPLIERKWYEISKYQLTESGCCKYCGTPLAGRFGRKAGDWGATRKPIRL